MKAGRGLRQFTTDSASLSNPPSRLSGGWWMRSSRRRWLCSTGTCLMSATSRRQYAMTGSSCTTRRWEGKMGADVGQGCGTLPWPVQTDGVRLRLYHFT